MKHILITGATGNLGFEVIRFLYQIDTNNRIIAGVRNIDKAKQVFKDFSQLDYAYFDFENPDSFDKSLEDIDIVFLLRPPHIADIETYFRPLIRKIKEKGINQILFLSVQGAEISKVIPHNKIEKLILEFNIDYIFLRPSYFMQNLTTTLLEDIQQKRKIILPAGKAKFNWIDVVNIGETAAMLLDQFDNYKNQIIELTGYENLSFYDVANLINYSVKDKIEFDNANPFRFYRIKRKEGIVKGMIIVMIVLHLLPRFQKEPKISDFFEKLTGKKPTTLKYFIEREHEIFTNPNSTRP
ncbi:MAG: NmrA family NAD(P)-binding protein [Bacteroidota bacterium]